MALASRVRGIHSGRTNPGRESRIVDSFQIPCQNFVIGVRADGFKDGDDVQHFVFGGERPREPKTIHFTRPARGDARPTASSSGQNRSAINEHGGRFNRSRWR